MAVALSTAARTQALASIRRFAAENFAAEIGELEVASILEFLLKEIAPTVYNGGGPTPRPTSATASRTSRASATSLSS